MLPLGEFLAVLSQSAPPWSEAYVDMSSQAPENPRWYLEPGGGQYVLWDPENPAGYGNRTGVYKTRVEWDFIRRHLPPAPAKVLDIAGGSGRFALRLIREGYALTVNDVHGPSLRLLEERAGERRPTIVHGGFLSSDIVGPFDAAIAIECLDRMPFDEAIRRVHGLLRPGSVFVFTVHNRSSWRFGGRRLVGREDKTEFVSRLSEYRSEWRKADFDEVGMRGLMWTALTVSSNSPLVPIFVGVESLFRLHALVGQSPWILVALRRNA